MKPANTVVCDDGDAVAVTTSRGRSWWGRRPARRRASLRRCRSRRWTAVGCASRSGKRVEWHGGQTASPRHVYNTSQPHQLGRRTGWHGGQTASPRHVYNTSQPHQSGRRVGWHGGQTASPRHVTTTLAHTRHRGVVRLGSWGYEGFTNFFFFL